MMFFLLIAGLGTGRWEFYFLFTAQFFLVFVALVLNLWTYFSFTCRYELSSERIAKGNTPTLKIYIHNNKPFSINGVHATVQTPLLSNHLQLTIDIEPNDTACFDVELTCKYRGQYEVGLTILEVTDIFGVLRMRFDLRRLPNYRMKQIVVYPRLLQLSQTHFPVRDEAVHNGLNNRRITTYGEEYHDIRQYRFGDPFKRIHKIISARKRELHVKRYDIPMEASIIIAVDNCKSSAIGEDALHLSDIACECAVAITNYHLQSGHAVALISASNNDPIIEGKQPRDFPIFFDYLARMSFDTQFDINSILQINPGSHASLSAVYIISQKNDKMLSNTLSALTQSGKYVRLLMPTLKSDNDCSQSDVSANGVIVTSVKNVDDIASPAHLSSNM